MPNQYTARPWKLIGTEKGPDIPLLRVRFDWLENPRNSKPLKALVLESPDWVNVVALTPERRLVVVRQFRFGSSKLATEIPAGIVEPGEDPEHAARRELLEETGYVSERWSYLGWVEPNPAIQNNHCHQWLAQDAVQVQQPMLDDSEDIASLEITLDELHREIRNETMRNSLALLALSRVFDLRLGVPRPQFENGS